MCFKSDFEIQSPLVPQLRLLKFDKDFILNLIA